MVSDILTFITDELTESAQALDVACKSSLFADQIAAISEQMVACLEQGRKIMFAGNGGSAADAQHIAGEFLSRLNYDRAPLAGVALTTDTSVLTAVSNDYGYEYVFDRQVAGLGRCGDVFVGISTSGRSKNILRAMRTARDLNITTVGFVGIYGHDMSECADLLLNAPSKRTPIIQQMHITAAHIICGLVERKLFPRG